MFCICVLIIAAAAVYMVEAYIHSLSELASINEAAAIVGNSEDITYKLRNLFNAEM